MTAKPKQKPGTGMELAFNPTISHPDVEMSWCLYEKTAKEVILGQLDGYQYCMLICSRYRREDGEDFEYRQLIRDVRLGFSFFRFFKHGDHEVTAVLLKFNPNKKGVWREINSLVRKAGAPGSYARNLDMPEEDWENPYLWRETFRRNYMGTSMVEPVEAYRLDVEIPSEIFADEPAKWLQDWVYLWSRYGAEDQCDFRRRAIFAFTLQPILLPIWELMKRGFVLVLAAIFLLWGRLSFLTVAGMAFKPQWRFTLPEAEINEQWDKDEHVPNIWKGRYGKFLGPIALLGYGAIGYILYLLSGPIIRFWTAHDELMMSIMGLLGAVITTAVLGYLFVSLLNRSLKKGLEKLLEGIRNVIGSWNEYTDEQERKKQQTKEERKQEVFEKRFDEARTYLTCGVAPSFDLARIESSPARKSVKLQFEAFKRKVCKPFVT